MTNSKSAALENLTDAAEVTKYFEDLHEICLKNMAIVYSQSKSGAAATASFLKHLACGFSAPIAFTDNGPDEVSNFVNRDPENLSMALSYAMHLFKYGRATVIEQLAVIMSDAWELNYSDSNISEHYCEALMDKFPASIIVYMCMLFPSATTGVILAVQAAPYAAE